MNSFHRHLHEFSASHPLRSYAKFCPCQLSIVFILGEPLLNCIVPGYEVGGGGGGGWGGYKERVLETVKKI
jgi:hypothetical protein